MLFSIQNIDVVGHTWHLEIFIYLLTHPVKLFTDFTRVYFQRSADILITVDVHITLFATTSVVCPRSVAVSPINPSLPVCCFFVSIGCPTN